MDNNTVPHVDKAIVQDAYDEGFEDGFRSGAAKQPADIPFIVAISSTLILISLLVLVSTMWLMGQNTNWVFVWSITYISIIALMISIKTIMDDH